MQNSKNALKWITFGFVTVFSLSAFAVGGVGVSIRQEQDGFSIAEVVVNSPAEQAGIFVGEKLKGVDGTSVSRKSLEEVVNMIRGTPGTCVVLSLEHESYPNVRNVKVMRYEIGSAKFHRADCLSH